MWRFGDRRRRTSAAPPAPWTTPTARSRWSRACSPREGFAVLDDSRTLAARRRRLGRPARRPDTDLYFFGYGRDYRDALRALYAVSGPTPLLPRFALGNWWSRYHRYTADEYLELMDRFADEGIPFSVARARHGLAPGRHRPAVRQRLDRLHAGTASCSPTRRSSCARCTSAGCGVTLNVHPADGVRAYEDAYPAMAQASASTRRAERRSPSTSPTRIPRRLLRHPAPLAGGATASTSGGSTGSRAALADRRASTRCGCSTTSTSWTPPGTAGGR